ncbi:phospholipase D family protein [Bdellovibrio sp. NC01]|uniref:phospholipase D family protein n=1 Tax=Bdellovibrio sp. NC01 TaxID=2220073 RepID=UPI00115B239B|nr:phospholipase D family protein [Bdellovibrio sp. NC01]QDK38654.1 phospholipase D family protein [Bdellovibrio sp. NC01]
MRLLLACVLICCASTGCSSLPKNPDRPVSYALPPDPNTRIAHDFAQRLNPDAHPGDSAFIPLVTGQDALLARIRSAHLADKTLDLQYYIWANDLTGHTMMYYVLLAADRGVRVRILLDDLNQGQYQKTLTILSSHPNIEIRMVNPFANRTARWLDFTRYSDINQRMHNKVFIADNQIAVVGGRNIGNEYFWASDEINFGDFDLWAMGSVAQDLSKEFDTYWNSNIVYPIESLNPDFKPTEKDLADLKIKAFNAFSESEQSQYAGTLRTALKGQLLDKDLTPYWAKYEVHFDPPEKFHQKPDEQKTTLRFQLAPYIRNTQKELILVSPYFVPRDSGLKFFKELQERGVQAMVLTNSLASSDQSVVFSGYKDSRKSLLKDGVHLYELKPSIPKEMKTAHHIGSSSAQSGLHGKVFVFDRKNIFVGSMNLDPRSLELNSEMGVVVHSPELATDFATQFITKLPETAYKLSLNEAGDIRWTDSEDGRNIIYDNEPETSWWKRFKAGFLSIFVPTSEL